MKPKHVKRAEGQKRNEAWRALSRSEMLAILDQRLGKGRGAKRQRDRLATNGEVA